MNDQSGANRGIASCPAALVVGIAARTSNAREMAGTGIIGQQWGRFVRDNLVAQIPERVDSAVVAVYTDYTSDKDGEYTFLIGARVKSAEAVPEGMVAKAIPAGKYAAFLSERGPVEHVVVQTWQRIWAAGSTGLITRIMKSTMSGPRILGAHRWKYLLGCEADRFSSSELYVAQAK